MNGAQLLFEAGVLLATPNPSDGEEFNSVTVSPGLPGFYATFVMAVLVVLLAISMTRHTRRIQARARVEERIEAEERAAAERPVEETDSEPADGQSADGQPSAAELTAGQPAAGSDDSVGGRPENGTPPSAEDR